MSVSLIAIISLGAPAYGYYEPYPAEAFYPQPAYAPIYGPYDDDEGFYGRATYRSHLKVQPR